MDLESYISSYSGYTRLSRLHLIAKKSPELREEALRMAFNEIRTTGNVMKFKELWTEFNEGRPYDDVTARWLAECEEKFRLSVVRLEQELSKHRTTVISKDSVRSSYQEMGALYLAYGDLNNSLKSYMRSRDYCTSPTHILNTCLDVIVVAIELGNYAFVNNFVSKAEATPESRQPAPASKLRSANGLSLLHTHKFRLAALKLLECSNEIGESWNKVLTGSDIAMYASLCALATFSRNELKTQVIENPNFREFLELAPNMRELLNAFITSKYALCIKHLDQLKGVLELDVHLHEHVGHLYKEVRHRAMVQYLAPYHTVSLTRMSATFVCPVPALEQELCGLIADGLVNARIDSQNKVLYSRQEDARGDMWDQVLGVANSFEEGALAVLLRAQCLHHGYSVKRPAAARPDTHPITSLLP
eukprot:c4478_g1_i1.p1 GENE.c4478_g1_i1~~c4478_g1_i1.p1  ORF type:complete len:437 (-),score=106.47 c4478_g1_i1:101-1354(-)